MSNMSTKIEDLPGGSIDIDNQEPVRVPEQMDISKYDDNKSNIQVEIVKKEESKKNELQVKPQSFMNELRSQINEENALLFVIFVIFSMNKFNNYLGGIPGLERFMKSEISFVLLKSGLAVLTFLLVKRFVLNKFSL